MSNISRRKFLVLSTAATAGAIVTACTPAAATEAPAPAATNPPAEPVATKAPEATAAPEATKAPEATAVPEVKRTWPVGDVARNKTLNYYWQAAPAAGNFNAFAAGYNHQTGNSLLTEPCAYYGAHADKTYLWLAESYKYNGDATEMTVTFRKGIKWSDGTAFTAKDVASGMERLKRVKGLNRAGVYVTELKSAEAVDDLNLKVTLTQPDFRLFFKSLTFRFDLGDDTVVQPDHFWSTVPDDQIAGYKVYDQAKMLPLTTGPYGVGTSNDQLTNYDLLPTWWAVETGFVDAMPAVERLTQTLFTNDTVAAQKLINNEIDQPLDLRPMVVASLLAQAGDHLTTWTGNLKPYGYTDWWPISVWFNTARPPWDNAKVRWAVSYAINRQQLVDVAWGGAGKAANSPFPEFKKLDDYMAGIKDLTDKYNVLEFNLDKTASLMGEAGFTKDKDGYWVDSAGKYPESNLYAPVPLFGDLGPVITQQLQNAGFKCEHKSPNDVWTAMDDGRASLYLFGHGGATIDPYDTFQIYRKADVMPIGQSHGANLARWSNDNLETIIEKMNTTAMDDPAMKGLFHDAMDIYYQNLPDAPIVQWFHRIPINTTYWTNWPNEKNPYMNSALWHLTCAIVMYGLKATGAA